MTGFIPTISKDTRPSLYGHMIAAPVTTQSDFSQQRERGRAQTDRPDKPPLRNSPDYIYSTAGTLIDTYKQTEMDAVLGRYEMNEVLVLAPTGNAANNLGRMFKAYWLACCSTGSSQKRAFNSCEVSPGQQHNAVYQGDRHSRFQTVALNQPAVQCHIVWDTCLSHQVLES
ncbi:hypothetical protein V8E54_008636 [Elaphomyces granulatus]